MKTRKRPPRMKKVNCAHIPRIAQDHMLKPLTSSLVETKLPALKKRKTTTDAPEEVGDDEEPEEASDDPAAAPGEDEDEEGDEDDVEDEGPEQTAKTSGPAAAAKRAKGGLVPKEVEVPVEGEEEDDDE